MSDVDAVRWMASEHDLEFVDLDTYGVDPAAGEILPASLSRRHHVVAIKRKFGTPVIATADPDDLAAQETVRDSIGRDFISVVASPDQIGDYIDQLFGPTDADGSANGAELGGFDGPSSPASEVEVEVELGPTAEKVERVELDEVESVERDEKAAGIEPELWSGPGYEPPFDGGEDSASHIDTQEPAAEDGSTGKRRRRRTESKHRGGGHAKHDIDPELGEITNADTVTAEPEGLVIEDPLTEDPFDDLSKFRVETSDTKIVAEQDGSPPTASSDFVDTLADEVDLTVVPTAADAAGSVLEPATNLLPEFASSADDSDWPSPPSSGTTEPDPLAALARSVEDGEQNQPSTDSAALAADLVAEAVATYEVEHAEDQRFDAIGLDIPTSTSLFPPLAKALVEGERVSIEDMEGVLEEHYRTGQTIARILTANDLVTEADLMWGMAEEMGLDFVDLDTVGVDFAEAGTIPEATARHHNVIVIANDDGTPVVAASNPTDVFAMDDLRTIMGRNFIVVVATRSQISSHIGRAFNSGGDAADMAMEASLGFDGSEAHADVDDIQAVTEEAPIVRYVNLLILQALNERASDIHVEPTATELRIRYRIDGVLHDVSTAPRSISAAVITRLKVMADMNVAEHRVPQDGRISLNVGSKGIDLRIATLPTIHGEKCVMRVLDKSSVVLGFPDLGFDEDLLTTYSGLYTKPYGTILVTGPTGSGKSTTLYTTLTALNSPEKNIITVEDPVELQLKGVNQIQLNVKAGLTFASALRSILRADPDIVLVGEIRDKETAVIAIEAALTGHMVLATLHTNSAASTPMRLVEMGLEPFLVTSALSGVLAQRLARRLCVHCKEAYEPTEADIAAAGWSTAEVEEVGGISKVYRSVGCSACANTGYRGRKALAELLPLTEEIERSIIEGGSVEDIHKIAVAQGMVTLRQSGLRKAIEGETTLEEVLRVVA
jgi:type IV pilus assembly protein PilB